MKIQICLPMASPGEMPHLSKGTCSFASKVRNRQHGDPQRGARKETRSAVLVATVVAFSYLFFLEFTSLLLYLWYVFLPCVETRRRPLGRLVSSSVESHPRHNPFERQCVIQYIIECLLPAA